MRPATDITRLLTAITLSEIERGPQRRSRDVAISSVGKLTLRQGLIFIFYATLRRATVRLLLNGELECGGRALRLRLH